MGALSAEERALLEQYAPYLQYDAQDGYRAVAAETMVKPSGNSLTRERGMVIAGGGGFSELKLEMLADYPGELEFEPGDRLVAAPNPLQEAVKMQRDPDFPHCAYGRVVPRGDNLFLQYWLWYYDNPKTFLGRGRHQGDWELVIVRLDARRRPVGVACSQHNAGEARPWKRVTKHVGDHPLVYVAPFSHANYFEPGTRFFFPSADHPTDVGPEPYLPAIAEFGDWQEWRGFWGASNGVLMGWRPLRRLVKGRAGGQSPPAPIAQEQRWLRPDAYYRGARWHRPISTLKKAIWQVGKLTFPEPPTILAATLANTSLRVKYTLGARSRHLLLTVHARGPDESMLLSHVLRKAPAAGEEILELPTSYREGDGAIVYASAFGPLGQRSQPVKEPIG